MAYAAACGVPIAPWYQTITASFSSTTQSGALNESPVDKLVQDTLITRVTYQIQNLNTPTSNFSSFAANQFQKQSGILVRMKVVGAPRFSVIDSFTPISEVENWPCGWVLGATNGVSMDFQSTMTLPFVPLIANVVFHGETSHWAKLIDASPQYCVQKLKDMDYDIGPYADLLT